MAREMKDSGIEWIGEIPRKWDLVKTKHCYSNQKVIVGENADEYERLALTLNGVIKRSKYDSTGLQPEAFNGYQILHKNELVFKLIDLENISTSRVGYSPYTGIVSPAYIVLHPNERKESRFGEYYFLSMWQREIFNHMGDDGVRSSLNAKDLMDTPYLRIPSSEKEIVVSFLDIQCAHIDSVIEKTRAAIEEYKKLKQSVITHAVTKGIRPNREMKDSGIEWIGTMPKDWLVMPSKWLFYNSDLRKQDGDEQMTASQQYGIITQKKYMELTGSKVVFANKGLEDWKHVEPNDFIISLRSFQGGLEMSESTGCITWHYIVLKPRKEIISYYYKWLFKSEMYIKALQRTCNYIRDGQDLRYSNFVQVPLIEPSLIEQKEIADFLNEKTAAIDSLIQKKEQLIKELDSYKKSLIYEYVTGKKEVSQPESKIKYTIEFKMALLMCRILQYTNIKGRIHMQKVIYSSDILLNLFSEIQYYRFQKGPYDINIEKYEHSLMQYGWVKVYKKGGKTIYKKTNDFNEYTSFYKKVFSEMDLEIKRICQLFNVLSTAQAGKTATVVASWNDFLIDGVTPTDEMIVNDIVTNWTTNKANIPRKTWFDTLEQIKSKGLVPKGFGKKTLHLEEAKHAH